MKLNIGLCIMACLTMFSCKQKTNSTLKNDSGGIDIGDDVESLAEGSIKTLTEFTLSEVPLCGQGRSRSLTNDLISDARRELVAHKELCREGLGDGYLCPQANVVVAKWTFNSGASGDVTLQHEETFQLDKVEAKDIQKAFNDNFSKVSTNDSTNTNDSSVNSTTAPDVNDPDYGSSTSTASVTQSTSADGSNTVTTISNTNSDSDSDTRSATESDSDTTSATTSVVVSIGVAYEKVKVKTEVAPDSTNHMRFIYQMLKETCYE